MLAAVWVYGIEKKPGQTLPIRDIAERFPKFVLGYFVLFLALLGVALARPDALDGLKAATAESDLLPQPLLRA